VNNILLFVLLWIVLLILDLAAIAARMSLLQISHARLLGLRDQIGDKVNSTLLLLPFMPRARASLNLLLVFLRLVLAGLAIVILAQQISDNLILWSAIALIVTALVLFWLEWLIERMVIQKPETWAVKLTGFVRLWMSIMTVPLLPLAVTNESQNGQDSLSSAVTEDELKSLVDAGQVDGVLELGERRMIYSIFELGETLAREIMVPRIDMQVLDVNTPLPEAVDALLKSGHSRVPVYQDNVDNTLGLLYAKELLRAWREDLETTSLHNLLRPAYFVPEAKKVDELLTEMQSQRIHLAIVVDEYGGVAGLVTLEDIVEEILGEILDEYDIAEEDPYQLLSDGGYLFLGRIGLDDFNEIFGAHLPSEEADTLGGYIYHELGHVPIVGEEVKTDDLVLSVEQVAGRRIKRVSAHRQTSETQDKEEEKDRVDR
jgi:CBS domain containing-hemolysin-like protein